MKLFLFGPGWVAFRPWEMGIWIRFCRSNDRGIGITYTTDGGIMGTRIAIVLWRCWDIDFVWIHPNRFQKEKL